MDSSAVCSCSHSNATPSSSQFKLSAVSVKEGRYKAQAIILEASFKTGKGPDKIDLDFKDLYKSLSVTHRNIVDKINELIKAKVPGGVQSLKPAEVTPEATADRIVQGSTAFFEAYARQHPELEGGKLLNSFMEKVRSGIQKGYDDAFNTLKGLGAFDVDGVQAGVEKTRELIEQKLQKFEELKRQQLGLDPVNAEQESANTTSQELLQQGGAKVLSVMA